MAQEPSGSSLDGTDEAFFAKFGRAFREWKKVEYGLLLLFQAMVQSRNPNWSALTFHEVNVFNTQMKLTDSLLRYIFPDPSKIRETWIGKQGLKKRITSAKTARDTLAHGTFITAVDPPRHTFIGDNPTNPKQLRDLIAAGFPEKISEKNLDALLIEFANLGNDTLEFAARVMIEVGHVPLSAPAPGPKP